MRENLVIRTDAGTQIGAGHAMRCLALAQEWKAGSGMVEFLSKTLPDTIRKRIEEEGCTVRALSAEPYTEEDAVETAACATKTNAQWIVVDGYDFSASYQQSIKQNGHKLLFIDDYGHAEHYCADIVLNQNVYASEELYESREPETKLLLGTTFALLRKEFAQETAEKEIAPAARKILVTLGGSDPENVTAKVIEAITSVKGLAATIVVGGVNPNIQRIQTDGDARGMEIIVDATNMKRLMEWADIAISGGGTTCYELACVGLPALSIVLADNQRAVAEGMEESDAAVNLGWHADVSPKEISDALRKLLTDQVKRTTMSQAGKSLVDGHGAARVCMELANEKLWLRDARKADCNLLFQWANNRTVRAAAFHSEPIEWEDHIEWFLRSLSDRECQIFIAINSENQPIGQIRFNSIPDGMTVEIDVHIDPKFQGKGYGSALINIGIRRMWSVHSAHNFQATIKQKNSASVRAFRKAGFSGEKTGVEHGFPVYYLSKNMNED
ncbi:MAG: UDP-2,4-diacetamido-2,4,6-trideoxy-beta-L-altropyranose hydrolase [Candidatus Peribacteraceae bacterium]|nr:UDP-2,4-diacetamido-2,4,6-trideoxy-beta-L-altropyranose hydrolase [Candidatus Peribacteraceae bacterium]